MVTGGRVAGATAVTATGTTRRRHNALMRSARLLAVHDLTVRLDYGHFFLRTATPEAEVAPAVLKHALELDGIAQADGIVAIVSPHQNNFAMKLEVQRWDGRPDDDLDAWDEAFEVHLGVGAEGLIYESPADEVVKIEMPSGEYHALIAGRGFVSRGWPGSTCPGDQWRIRIWPSEGPARALRLRQYQPQGIPSRAIYLSPARAAAERINRDLVGGPQGRCLSDQSGVAIASYGYNGSRESLFAYAADLSLWTSASSNSGPLIVGGGYEISHNEITKTDFDGLPTGGTATDTAQVAQFLRGTYLELDEPSVVTTQLEWFRVAGIGAARETTPVLAKPTIVRVQLTETTTTAGATGTTIHINHSHLPDVWAEDFVHVWMCKLEAGDLVYDLGH